MGTIFVDNIKQQSSQGSGTITIGASGETVALASGVNQSNMLYPSFSFARVDFNDDPTKPLLPKIKTLILIPLTYICNCIF